MHETNGITRAVRIDIRDVARHARVSTATVSRTINNIPTVNEGLADRVRSAIRELNYYPNNQARALVSGKSRLIGLLVPDITNPFFPELIKRFEQAAVEHGYELLIGSADSVTDMGHCLRRMIERNVDAVAVMTFGAEDAVLEDLSSRNIPMIFVDIFQETFSQDALLIDYKHGMKQAMEHLVALGHREVGFISGPLNQHSATLRREAFLASAEESGCQPDQHLIVEGDHQLEGGMRGMTLLLQSAHPPTAVLCSNDMMAIGALRTLHQRGFRVPQDMSVVGFDDIHLAEFINPPLTTVSMSRTEIAYEAVKTLLRRIESNVLSGLAKTRPISTRLIVRETTAPPRATRERRRYGTARQEAL